MLEMAGLNDALAIKSVFPPKFAGLVEVSVEMTIDEDRLDSEFFTGYCQCRYLCTRAQYIGCFSFTGMRWSFLVPDPVRLFGG